MPYALHPEFPTPSDDVSIWRYMDLIKFKSLLVSSALYFPSSDNFEDKYEGYVPPLDIEGIARSVPERMREQTIRILEPARSTMRDFRRAVLISCWHRNDHESAAMWKMYAGHEKGIAIRTTVGRLKSAFAPAESAIWIGEVAYKTNEELRRHTKNAFRAYLRKRKSFTFECEVRAMCLTPVIWNLRGPIADLPARSGASMPVDLPRLVQEVYVAPKCDDRFLASVRAAIDDSGLRATVIRSDLDSDPVW
jgi:hypothetical protein